MSAATAPLIIENLQIEALAFGGSGVGRHQGQVVFVPATAPGDVIRCRILREKKRFAEGEVGAVLEPSPQRRAPLCPVFGQCGGCQWQHLDYPVQSVWKERLFVDTLQRHARVDPGAIRPMAAAPQEWGYRSRAQFKCRQTDHGFVMGFFRRGSHFVIDLQTCPILHPRLNAVLHLFRQVLPQSPCPTQIPQVDVAVGDDLQVRVVVHFIGADAGPLAAFLQPWAREHGFSLFLQTGRKETLQHLWGEEDLTVEVGAPPLHLAYGPGGFAQVNLEQNRTLVAAVVEAAGLQGTERVLDLYCGMGNFSLPLARQAREVVGVEDYPLSIAKACQNARTAGISNAHFYAETAEGAARRYAGQTGFDLVTLDPPRSGAFAVVKELARLRPPRIHYISCDPATLARDLLILLHAGYALEWSRPFDLFPQTYHTESLTLLCRCD